MMPIVSREEVEALLEKWRSSEARFKQVEANQARGAVATYPAARLALPGLCQSDATKWNFAMLACRRAVR